MGLGSLHLTSHAPVTKFKISVMDLFVRFSPPSALYQRQQGGLDWLSRPLVLYPTNDIEISDAQVHQRGTGGRQYVVCLLALRDMRILDRARFKLVNSC